MTTHLFHVTSPAGAYDILSRQVFTPRSLHPNCAEACMPVLCTELVGQPVTRWVGQPACDAGAAILLEWHGIEQPLKGWDVTPAPDILYHEYAQRGFQPSPRYVRSVLPAGTQKGLFVTGLLLDHDVLALHWQNGLLPPGLEGGGPGWLRSLTRTRSVARVARQLYAMASPSRMSLKVDGPCARTRQLHADYHNAIKGYPLDGVIRGAAELCRSGMLQTAQVIRDPGKQQRFAAGCLLRMAGISDQHDVHDGLTLMPGSALLRDSSRLLESLHLKTPMPPEQRLRANHCTETTSC